MQEQTVNTFENIYDKYSHMLYGIALEISISAKEADQILIAVFHKFHTKYFSNAQLSLLPIRVEFQHSLCATLIKLTIQTAHEQTKLKINFKLKQFENTPLLHLLLCEQISLEQHCIENKISPNLAARQIREEFKSFRNLKREGKSNLEMSAK